MIDDMVRELPTVILEDKVVDRIFLNHLPQEQVPIISLKDKSA